QFTLMDLQLDQQPPSLVSNVCTSRRSYLRLHLTSNQSVLLCGSTAVHDNHSSIALNGIQFFSYGNHMRIQLRTPSWKWQQQAPDGLGARFTLRAISTSTATPASASVIKLLPQALPETADHHHNSHSPSVSLPATINI